MDRWTWMALKAYVPAMTALAGAVASMWVISGWKDNLYLAGMVGVASWVPIVGFAVAVGLGSWTTYRLWRWERGEALVCDCGGLLGRERPGVRDRGDYRRCLACGRNMNHRHYS